MQLTLILCLLATARGCDEDRFMSDEGKMNVQTVMWMIRKFITHLIFGMPEKCLKTDKDLAHFGLESGMVFEGTIGLY